MDEGISSTVHRFLARLFNRPDAEMETIRVPMDVASPSFFSYKAVRSRRGWKVYFCDIVPLHAAQGDGSVSRKLKSAPRLRMTPRFGGGETEFAVFMTAEDTGHISDDRIAEYLQQKEKSFGQVRAEDIRRPENHFSNVKKTAGTPPPQPQ